MVNSVYIHIPFCIRKCLYCDFASYPGMESLFTPYVEALKAEIRQGAERFPDTHVSTIFFGGGTPNVLSAEQLIGILDEVRHGFDVDEAAEISTEANPGVAGSRGSFSHLASGFNRISLGVQSFHDNELRRLGRIHTAAEAIQAFHEVREAGFDNINIDLMYGIPEQTIESWRQTLAQALSLGTEHISLYSLSVEEGTPFWDMCQAGRLELPGNDIEADMYEEAIRTLTSAGFVHYEISNFARPGFECRHNITYWHNEPYFGFGSGAASYLPACEPNAQLVRATNTTDVREYIRRIRTGADTHASSECLTGRESMGETMFLGLRMLQGISVDTFVRRYGCTPMDAFPSQIADLKERGLIQETAGYIRLTHTGLFLANDVFAEFVG